MIKDTSCKNLTRREFLKKTGQAALALGGGLALEALLDGCAGAPIFESSQDVARIRWDANPAIPVPENGCYAGWHKDIPVDLQHFAPNMYEDSIKAEEITIDSYETDYGKRPPVHSFSDRSIGDERFPTGVCEGAYNKAVIPLIRYYFRFNKFHFENVAKGDYDNELKAFAQGAKEFGKPFFLVPYPEANIGGAWKHVHPWAGGNGKDFTKAWKRMHDIFDDEGANEYAVWGLHLIGMGAGQPFSWFAVDPDIIDWVGFSIYNLERESGQDRAFSNLMREAYYFAKGTYPTKPIALWEFGSSNTSGQGSWIKRAYKDITKLPRIKLVVYAEYPMFGGSTPDSTMISDKAKPDYKQAISDPYFIGSKPRRS